MIMEGNSSDSKAMEMASLIEFTANPIKFYLHTNRAKVKINFKKIVD
jgi:hypothetical protein